MKNDPEIYKKAKGFDKNPQNINKKGRPPKLINSVIKELKEKGYNVAKNADIVDAYMTLVQLPINEIEKIAQDKEQPMFLRIVAKRLLQKDGFEIIEKMIDRAHGKARQEVEGKYKIISVPEISDKELRDINERLEDV